MIELRPFQQECIQAVVEAWENGIKRPAVVLPTAAGKTVVFVSLCSALARAGNRPLILVDRQELVDQTVDKIRKIDPALSVGIIKAEKQQLRCDVTVGSIQTLGRQSRLNKISTDRFDRIIYDECHGSGAPGPVRILTYFGAFDDTSTTLCLGVTATMTRMGKPQPGGKQLGEIWQKVVFEKSIRWMIEQGYLAPLEAKTVTLPNLDLKGVKTVGGDFVEADLGKALAQAEAGPIIAKAYNELARKDDGELRRGMLFCPTIATATAFAQDFNDAGIRAELVIGETPLHLRREIYRRVETGETKVLAGVGVFTQGFDLPAVEVICLARPTKSRGLFTQVVGRGLRLSPSTGKTSALLIDLASNAKMGLATIIDLDLEDPKPVKPGEGGPRGPRNPGEIPEAPNVVSFIEIDPFTGQIKGKKGTKWKLTNGGRWYMPATSTFEAWIFLQRDGNNWLVGSMPTRKGKASLISTHNCIQDALAAGLDAHPYGHRPFPKLSGAPSPGQLRILQNFKVETPEGLTKEQASQRIDLLFASSRMD